MTMLLDLPPGPALDTCTWLADSARSPVVRSVAAWSEEEVVLPDGPFANEPFRIHYQPFSRLFFEELDRRRYSRVASVGPTQTGKTLLCFVIPVCHHLFEIGETAGVGLPSMDMANDKWSEDIRPVIEASPSMRALLPTRGEGSRGGAVKRAVQFQNGSTLRFFGVGGSDKQVAGFTTRVMAMTEVDGYDEASETSREADKIKQLEARTRAFGRRGKAVYLECTASTPKGRIWLEYKAGTASRIVVPCPKCSAWVCPEREHLAGWESADSAEQAADLAHFLCPACESPWTEADRIAINQDCRLLHAGQAIDSRGAIDGEAKPTNTFGFRWSGFHNLFTTAADLGAEEFNARRDHDEENAEKELKQFVWAVPYDPPEVDLTQLDFENLKRRTGDLSRGFCPSDTRWVTLGIDLGKRLAHYFAVAWRHHSAHLIDYGLIEIPSDDLGVHKGTLVALREIRDRIVLTGYPREGSDQSCRPTAALIDAGWHESAPAVYALCRETSEQLGGELFRPSVGFGAGQQRKLVYKRPSQKSTKVRLIGQNYHFVRLRNERLLQVEVDANYWKSWLHQSLSTPKGSVGAMTLFTAPPHEHTKLAKHLTAEKQVETYEPGKGTRVVWETVRRANHFLDAAYLACAAGHIAGFRIEPGGEESAMEKLSRAAKPGDSWWAKQKRKKA